MNSITEDVEVKNGEHFIVGIVGNGPDVEAHKLGFNKPSNYVIHADGINVSYDDLLEERPNIIFLFNEVEYLDDGTIIASDLEEHVIRALSSHDCGIVIKTFITPELIDRLAVKSEKIVYSPSVYYEQDNIVSYMNQPYMMLGGRGDSSRAVAEVYSRFSTINSSNFMYGSGVEIAFAAGAIQSFLQVKNTWFNQLYDAVQEFGGDAHWIINNITSDSRIGYTHVRPYDYAGKRGISDQKLLRNVKAFNKFNKKWFTISEESDKINTGYINRKA